MLPDAEADRKTMLPRGGGALCDVSMPNMPKNGGFVGILT